MQITMDRLSQDVFIGGDEPEATITNTYDKEVLREKVNKDGIDMFSCKKFIPKFLRKEISIVVKEKGKNDMEFIYEVRATKLLNKRVVEVRKEK